jgi:hypothetical protein
MSSDETATQPGQERRERKRLRSSRRVVGPRNPRLPYLLTAAAVGLLMAVLAQLLVIGGQQACEVVRGTSSCGSAGGFMLLAIGLLLVLAGTRLLRALAVPDPVITSVLGVALVTIVVLAVLIDVIFSIWMWVVLPLVAAVAYGFSAWAAKRMAAAGSASG